MYNTFWLILGLFILYVSGLLYANYLIPASFSNAWVRGILYLGAVILAFALSWTSRLSSPVFSAIFGALAFTLLCQLATFFVHLEPIQAGFRASFLLGIANMAPFVSIVFIPILYRSGIRGVIGSIIGIVLGWALAVIMLHVLSLVKLHLFL